MNADQVAKLREAFPAKEVGKLPKITCGSCSKANTRNCDKHQKSKCATCGSWITTAHTHLDYVGHAAVTNRLLAVDPEWTWEPVAFDQHGLPAIDQHGGLWIRLTVADVTRLGYGHADGKTGGNALKEAIGDAIRNAAMRFGVAVDLWHKGSLSGALEPTGDADTDDEPRTGQPPAAQSQEPASQAPPAPRRTVVTRKPQKAADAPTEDTATESQVRMAMALCSGLHIDDAGRHDMVFAASSGRTTHVRELTKAEMSRLIDDLKRPRAEVANNGLRPGEEPF